MGRVVDETGNRYGRLTVVRRNPENAYHKGAAWICSCECGGERVASGIGLRQGLIKSCGCLAREKRVPRCACGYKGQKTRDWTPDWKCYRCSGGSPLDEPLKMTDEELLQKRAEHWRFYHRTGPTSASHDVMLFLNRLEQLESELAEANARRDDLRTALEWANEECDRLREKLAAKHSACPDCESYSERAGRFAAQADKLQRERDEARNALFRADQDALRVEEERDQLRVELKMAREGCDGWVEKCEQLTRERDEARAEVEHAYREGGALYEAKIAQREAETERDEARAEVDRLKESAKAAWEVECITRDSRDRYHAELKQERAEVERLRNELSEAVKSYARANDAWWNCAGAMKERDEARAELHASNEQMDFIAKALQLEHDDDIEDAVTDMVAEMEHARDRIEELRTEVERLRLDIATSNESFAAGYKDGARDAYRRGAEAMRLACREWCIAWENEGRDIADALADLAIPEEP